ncbi:MAG: hypothetical protein KAU20_01575 [Nanoarchaeota archaeon]|nr:hypothetical protein [Nanoarchaeota archaeon]
MNNIKKTKNYCMIGHVSILTSKTKEGNKGKSNSDIIKERKPSQRIMSLLTSFEQKDYKKNYVFKNYSKTIKNKKPIEQFKYYLENNPVVINDNELLVGGIFLRFKDIKMELKAGNAFKRVIGDSYFSTGVKGYSIRTPPGYKNIIKFGFAGLRDKSLRLLKKEKDPEKIKFLENSAKANDLACKFIAKYSEEALRKSKTEKNLSRKRELLKIAKCCHDISVREPRHFYEGVQIIWFTKVFGAVGGLGRFDQYLWKLFKKDLKEGRLNYEGALDLIEDFWIKCNLWNQGWTAPNDSWQHITLSGLKPNGGDGTNDLTYLCLQAQYDLKLPEPKVSVRFSGKHPEGLVAETCKVLRLGLGMPSIYNDKVVIPGLKRLGISLKDARDYTNNGCSEIILDGNSTTCFAQINLLDILNKTIRKKAFSNFKDLLDTYKVEIEKEIQIPEVNSVTHPLLASTMDDCLLKGSGNCARYILKGSLANATPNAVDGLAAINKLVFEDKKLSLNKFIKALDSNFKDNSIRHLIINVPKYGNDESYADLIAKDIAEYFCDAVLRKYPNKKGDNIKVSPGLLAFDVQYLRHMDASPDGRKKGEHVANAISPAIGRDLKGPTAVINSARKIDFRKASYGSVLDMVFYSGLFSQQTEDRFVDFIRTFLKYPSTATLHVNFLDIELLKAVQKDPKNPAYKNIIVRVWGFSAYFVDLDKDLQDHIIKRTQFM